MMFDHRIVGFRMENLEIGQFHISRRGERDGFGGGKLVGEGDGLWEGDRLGEMGLGWETV